MPEDPRNRRQFFRELVDRCVGPAADFVGAQLGKVTEERRLILRPPGALPERQFLDTCYRCGTCADVCPAEAILTIKGADDELNGTPRIAPRHQPCKVCDGLKCMAACPPREEEPRTGCQPVRRATPAMISPSLLRLIIMPGLNLR